jgi:hypothetical protein
VNAGMLDGSLQALDSSLRWNDDKGCADLIQSL